MANILFSSDCGFDGLTFHLPSKVQPQFARDSDIGVVVQRFLKSGQLPAMIERPTIADATDLPDDFASLMDRIRAVRQQFDMMPEAERAKFNNSCDNWLEYLAAEAAKAAEPPAVEPPAVEPPAVEPPAVEPPAGE